MTGADETGSCGAVTALVSVGMAEGGGGGGGGGTMYCPVALSHTRTVGGVAKGSGAVACEAGVAADDAAQ